MPWDNLIFYLLLKTLKAFWDPLRVPFYLSRKDEKCAELRRQEGESRKLRRQKTFCRWRVETRFLSAFRLTIKHWRILLPHRETYLPSPPLLFFLSFTFVTSRFAFATSGTPMSPLKYNLLRLLFGATFETFGLLFIPTSGHIGLLILMHHITCLQAYAYTRMLTCVCLDGYATYCYISLYLRLILSSFFYKYQNEHSHIHLLPLSLSLSLSASLTHKTVIRCYPHRRADKNFP